MWPHVVFLLFFTVIAMCLYPSDLVQISVVLYGLLWHSLVLYVIFWSLVAEYRIFSRSYIQIHSVLFLLNLKPTSHLPGREMYSCWFIICRLSRKCKIPMQCTKCSSKARPCTKALLDLNYCTRLAGLNIL